MHFDPVDGDRIYLDATGDYQRGSVTVALVGEMRCSIEWTMNALGVHLPINAHRALSTYPHPSLDVARNLAIREWLKESTALRSRGKKWQTAHHLFLWPTEAHVPWNAISESMQTGKPVLKIGEAYCFTAEGIDPERAPWFKDGKWQGGPDAFEMEMGTPEPLTNLPPASPDEAITGEQIFVTALPSLGFTSLAWISHALALAAPVACVKILAVMKGREVADARNRIVESVLKMRPRPQFIFFYGDDNLPEPNSLQLLWETMHKRNSMACAGVYNMKYRPPVQPLLWRTGQPGWLVPGRDYQPGDVIECDGTGMDFSIIKTEVFEKIPRPWFKTGMEHIPGKGVRIFTEDAHFWQQYVEHVKEKVLVDTRATIGHYDCNSGEVF